jgi:DNA-binding HxlR family transcriptional regulator
MKKIEPGTRIYNCDWDRCLQLIGGKWKSLILPKLSRHETPLTQNLEKTH